MLAFFDSSAFVKRYVAEEGTEVVMTEAAAAEEASIVQNVTETAATSSKRLRSA